ncbi:MAG: hypothetical protein AAF368_02155 [Planctomycetota bacterium]
MDLDPPSAPLVPLQSRPSKGAKVNVELPVGGSLRDGRGPRGVGQLLDEAVEVLRVDFLRMAGMAMIVWFPVRLSVSLIGLFGPQGMDMTGQGDPEEAVLFMVLQMVTGMWTAVTQTIALAFVSVVVFAGLSGSHVTVWQALKTALRKLPALIVIGIATTVATGMGAIFCLAPGIWLMWKLQLCSMLPVLEGATIGNSFSRSWNLTTGSFWRWAGLLLTSSIVLSPFTSVAAFPYDPTMRPMMFDGTGWDPLTFELIMIPLTTLLFGMTSALMGAVHTVYYVDQRVRVEGLDLDLQLEEFERQRALRDLRRGRGSATGLRPDEEGLDGPGLSFEG